MRHQHLMQILELARWAPSGDNTQPWRFEITSDTSLRVHGHDTRDHILYDFDGHPSHIAHGALLETMRIAASGLGQQCEWEIDSHGDDREPVYNVSFTPAPGLARDPLADCIKTRMVQRRPMRLVPLADGQRRALAAAAGDEFSVQLFESLEDRRRVAKLLWDSAHVRLTCPEAYSVHKEIIEWGVRYSTDRIPEQAVGVDPATAKLMQWVMQSWERVDFFNRYLLGTVAPRLQLDVLPAICCSAHVLLKPRRPLAALADWVRLGGAVQRVWLTATLHGLHLQPEMTPVIFRWYSRAGRRFSEKAVLHEEAARLSGLFESIAGAAPGDGFGFFARVGVSPTPRSRSIRKEVAALMK